MKRFKELDEGARSLVESGQWLQLLKSLKTGIFEIKVPDYSALRSLQVTASKVNVMADHPYKITTKAKYQELILQVEVDKK